MKINIPRETFSSVFQIAAAVANNRSPKAILQTVKLDVDEGVTLSATDQEVGMRLQVEGVDIQQRGSAILPVQRVGMMLRESSEERLNLEITGEKLVLEGQHARIELASQNPDEFPEVARFEEHTYFELEARTLRELIRRTLFATESESSRYALGGVLLEFADGKVTAVGTDGRRMAKAEGAVRAEGTPNPNDPTIVPARAMMLIERMLPGDESEKDQVAENGQEKAQQKSKEKPKPKVQLAPRSNDLLMRYDGGVFYTRLVEGRFPRWREVIPQRSESKKISINAGPFLQSLRQAAIVASEESRGVEFTFSEGKVVLHGLTADVGQSRVEFPVEYCGEELTISLDHRYMADFLKVLQYETLFVLDVVDSEQAAYCSTADQYGYVIMPLAIERR